MSRRKFIAQLGATSAVLAAPSWLEGLGYAQITKGPARVTINQARYRSLLDRRLLGSFLEHLGRAIYTGIYEPGSKLADEEGFRKDVIAEVHELGVPIIRYPGGNFVSGYHWLDGVGPKDQRPTVLDRAWNTLDTNQFGTNEFMDWCKRVNTEPLLGFNLGTGTPEMAAALVEYCNVEKGTEWSDLRRKHGYPQPHNVKYWCLGNEMDGPWQMGHCTAREYGEKARDAARQIRKVDPDVKLIACGSSNTILDTYLVWDREVLEQCFDQVDGISLHNYYGNTPELTGNNSARYLAMNLDMERQIHEIAAVCDYVQGTLKSSKRLWLSFDEWNVWYRARGGRFADGQRTVAPHLLEEVYNLEDALAGGRFPQHVAAPVRPRARRLSGPTGECHRPAGHQRNLGVAPEHLLSVRVGLEIRARQSPRSAGGIGNVSDSRGRPARRLRPQRRGPLRGRHRHARSGERTGLPVYAESRSRCGAGAGGGIPRSDAEAGFDV